MRNVDCKDLTLPHRFSYLSLNQRLDSTVIPEIYLKALLLNCGLTLELPGACSLKITFNLHESYCSPEAMFVKVESSIIVGHLQLVGQLYFIFKKNVCLGRVCEGGHWG